VLIPKPKVWKLLKKVEKMWSHELKSATTYYQNESCQGESRNRWHSGL